MQEVKAQKLAIKVSFEMKLQALVDTPWATVRWMIQQSADVTYRFTKQLYVKGSSKLRLSNRCSVFQIKNSLPELL